MPDIDLKLLSSAYNFAIENLESPDTMRNSCIENGCDKEWANIITNAAFKSHKKDADENPEMIFYPIVAWFFILVFTIIAFYYRDVNILILPMLTCGFNLVRDTLKFRKGKSNQNLVNKYLSFLQYDSRIDPSGEYIYLSKLEVSDEIKNLIEGHYPNLLTKTHYSARILYIKFGLVIEILFFEDDYSEDDFLQTNKEIKVHSNSNLRLLNKSNATDYQWVKKVNAF